jgi:hypothetical protein
VGAVEARVGIAGAMPRVVKNSNMAFKHDRVKSLGEPANRYLVGI